eukprot:CAMPEP_0117446032 /NCGR_PEP_ID=MMETSP0759-20121206/6117_1 /TAXON_ID=63605 /ORGANISM="Percolomonas cosmopolitus, Strain WS" /LENGTH=763 /DNA_ID=CAMNT_0005238257 /DNA_START=104 /DNA_END=2391 /DNA_ORIENTATION=-
MVSLKKQVVNVAFAYLVFFGIVGFLGLLMQNNISARNPLTIRHEQYEAKLSRDASSGVAIVDGATMNDVALGLGYMHALDRGMQIFLQRFVAQGRLAEIVKATDETVKVDKYIRKFGFERSLVHTMSLLTDDEKEYLKAYADGVNLYFQRNTRPIELRLLKYNPLEEPFRPEDILLIGKLMPLLGMSDTQAGLEKFLIEVMQSPNGVKFAKSLMKPYLDDMDDEIVKLLENVTLEDTTIPNEVLKVIGSISNSNNWVVNGKLSESGKPVLVTDPHMRIDHLPSVWYEAILKTDDNYVTGITVAGVPLVVMGRTKKTSYGFTFSPADLMDYEITHCRMNAHNQVECKVDEPDVYKAVNEVTEIIKRKDMDSPIEYKVRQLSHSNCILEAPQQFKEGYYLCHAYVSQTDGGAYAVKAFTQAVKATTVDGLQKSLRHADIGMNMILADDQGNIGYQQCGRHPVRQHSGLFPFPSWDKNFRWKGIVDANELVSYTNPDNGWIATANNDINPNRPFPIVNAHMGNYRVDRIAQMIEKKINNEEKFAISDMRRMLLDVKSEQCEAFMRVLRPQIRTRAEYQAFSAWDCTYDRESIYPTIFEEFLTTLHVDVFGRIFSAHSFKLLKPKIRHFYYFDRFILDYSERDQWLWKSESQTDLFKRVFEEVWSKLPSKVDQWGKKNTLRLGNLFWSKALPPFVTQALGIDVEFEMSGSRATVSPFVKGADRAVGVSWRMIADMAYGMVLTNLPGGVNDRIFSRYYVSDLFRWYRG